MRRAAGFTLVELMITVAVVAVLLALGVPTLRGVIENGRIRAAGESWKYGLALARTEAVRRNARVEFFTEAGGWEVRLVTDGEVLHQAAGTEGAQRLTVSILPEDATRVTYDSFGRVLDPNPDGSEPITQVDVESMSPPPDDDRYHPLRLQVLAGGMTRLCDPKVAATDSRACL